MCKTRFSVKIPKSISCFMLLTGLVTLIIPVLFTVFQGKLPVAAYCLFFLLSLPFLIAALWMSLFQIDVEEDRWTVRRGIGIRYSFQVSEIEKVEYKIKQTGMGTSVAICIFAKRHKIAVSNMMGGSDKLDAYIQNIVPADRIVVKGRDINNR